MGADSVIKVGDTVALVTLDGSMPVKVIGETKKYFRVDLKSLPENHMARFTFECDRNPETIILDSRLYSKTSGYERGSGDYESKKYCPNYITELKPRIEFLKKFYERERDPKSSEQYWNEILVKIELLEKALREEKQA